MTLRLGTRHEAAPDRAFKGVELRRLDWDTNFFGRKMGILELNVREVPRRQVDRLTADLCLALREAAADGYAHLILRIPSDRTNAIRAAEEAGLRLVDAAVDLVVRLRDNRPTGLGQTNVRQASDGDIDALREIAGQAFELSRFASDPFFASEEVSAFYRQWIANLCDGLAAEVLVATAGDEIAGFVACALESAQHGRIPLIATGEPHRRQGIGRALVEASLGWFASSGQRAVFVKTQAANYPALALYQQFGFQVIRSEVTLSVHLNAAESPR